MTFSKNQDSLAEKQGRFTFKWNGRPDSELTRFELIAIIKYLDSELDEAYNYIKGLSSGI